MNERALPRLQAAQDSVKQNLERFLRSIGLPSLLSDATARLSEALWTLEETAASYGYEPLSTVAMELRLVLLNEPMKQFTSTKLDIFRRLVVEASATEPDEIDSSRCSQALRRGGLNWIPPLEQFGQCPDGTEILSRRDAAKVSRRER